MDMILPIARMEPTQDSMCAPISGKNYMDIVPTIHSMMNSRIF